MQHNNDPDLELSGFVGRRVAAFHVQPVLFEEAQCSGLGSPGI
jgi:hypothetical protein